MNDSNKTSVKNYAVVIFACIAFLGGAACGGNQKRTSDLLYDIRAYNEGIRWQKYPQSAVRILPEERDAFLDIREDLEEELRIDDFEITRMKMHGKDKEMANVQVKWTWHMDREGIVHTTTTGQKWKRYGKRWMMLKEVVVRGDEMPGVKEAEIPDEDAEAGENSVQPEEEATETKANSIGAYRSVERALLMSAIPNTITMH